MIRKQRYFTLSVAALLVTTGAPLYQLALLDAGLLITGITLFALALWPAPDTLKRALPLQQREHA